MEGHSAYTVAADAAGPDHKRALKHRSDRPAGSGDLRVRIFATIRKNLPAR
jgi:hypothetical protein